MSGKLNVVGISGSLSAPSRTLSLVQFATERLGRELDARVQVVDVSRLPQLGLMRSREAAGREETAAFAAVEAADLLVIGSPVYKGSYSGLFKHFIDFVDYGGLVGKPVALLATGGSERHALVIEHQLRPLFAFFQAQPLGTGLFLTEREWSGSALIGEPAEQRFERLVHEAVSVVRHATLPLAIAAE
ncbi:NAD(P)H-dependent oxidoreductase [Ancylobacter sonchi]|uniref:NAD(P)H-dependent oxidoreductase n=1 Tax=Ancylobacter sonchi TaxID=1937790 RepID=UPI001BD28DE1|nr:NAD(P)H-dependent oxidoreductase [Ancylobacter sonchi]MBS7535599.1 NAD(P)H-dependent oxidoreductase [Ancylobacter sonchi]